MVKRPLAFVLLANALVAIAVSFPLQVMLIYEHALDEWDLALAKLTVLNWAIVAGCLLCSWLSLRGSRKLQIALPSLSALVLANNLIVGSYGVDFSLGLTAVASGLFASLNLVLILPTTRRVFAQPLNRPWIRAGRRRANIPVLLDMDLTGSFQGKLISAQTFDLSMTGVFVSAPLTDVKVGEMVLVRLDLEESGEPLCLSGRVVRGAEARGVYPTGYGIAFTKLAWGERLALQRWMIREI